MRRDELGFIKGWACPVIVGLLACVFADWAESQLFWVTMTGPSGVIFYATRFTAMLTAILFKVLKLLIITVITQFGTVYDGSGRCRARAQRSCAIMLLGRRLIAMAIIGAYIVSTTLLDSALHAASILLCLTGRLRLPTRDDIRRLRERKVERVRHTAQNADLRAQEESKGQSFGKAWIRPALIGAGAYLLHIVLMGFALYFVVFSGVVLSAGRMSAEWTQALRGGETAVIVLTELLFAALTVLGMLIGLWFIERRSAYADKTCRIRALRVYGIIDLAVIAISAAKDGMFTTSDVLNIEMVIAVLFLSGKLRLPFRERARRAEKL